MAIVKSILENVKEIFINGNFLEEIPSGEEAEEANISEADKKETVTTPFYELLSDARRLPELVFLMKVNDNNCIKRIFKEDAVRQKQAEIIEKIIKIMKLINNPR